MNDETANNPTPVPSTADVVVVGGGLAGLTTAALVAGRGRRVVLLESGRLGGRGRTDEVDGSARLNRGAHALYDAGEARRILAALGVTWTGRPPATARGELSTADRTVPIPGTSGALVRSPILTWRDKVALAGFQTRLPRQRPAGDVSALTWLQGCGLQGRGLDLALMLLRTASYCADATALSADAAAEQLRLALRGVTYIDGGWQTLVDQLASICRARGVVVIEHTPVISMTPDGAGWSVAHAAGAVRADAVVLAGMGPAAVRMLLDRDDLWADVGESVTAACLDAATNHRPRVPALFDVERPLYFSEHTDPDGDDHVVHLLRYTARSATEDRADLEIHARRAGVDVDTARASRFLARMVVAHALPSPRTGGLAGRPGVAVPGTAGVFVAGDWVGERGLLLDAALASAEAAATAAIGVAGDRAGCGVS